MQDYLCDHRGSEELFAARARLVPGGGLALELARCPRARRPHERRVPGRRKAVPAEGRLRGLDPALDGCPRVWRTRRLSLGTGPEPLSAGVRTLDGVKFASAIREWQ